MSSFLLTVVALAADTPQVGVPRFEDEYSVMVRKLESGQTQIDYRGFRESFLRSKQFLVASAKSSELDQLQAALPALMSQSKYLEVIRTTKKILSIDYTNMRAHKVLQQTYKILKDEANRQKYHDIEFGLLGSIVKNGDGKSCKTAWPVIQIEEEYFILEMMDVKLVQQTVENEGGLCDKMEVSSDKGKTIYYFDIVKLMDGRKRREKK